MLGLMQNKPLLIKTLIEHAERNHAEAGVISRQVDGSIRRFSYAQTATRARRMANAIARLGLRRGDRIATLAWNTHRHFELYYAISCPGYVSHTINPRLFFEQIAFIVEHAEDQVMFFDISFVKIVEDLAARPDCPVKTWIALCDAADMPKVKGVSALCYEDLIEAHSDDFVYPDFDENTASSLCYTSGTTGAPKGVLYSHRSTVLHAMASTMPDAFSLSASECVMPLSSMFHANAWGLPYAITMTGAKLVLPAQHMDPKSLLELINDEGVTISCGVPTIWLGVIQHMEAEGVSMPTMKELIIGGSSCPEALMNSYRDDHGVNIAHIWGMTETSPLGTVGRLLPKHADLPQAEKNAILAKQGRTMYGVELKIQNDRGAELPRDGEAFGDLMIRGYWVSNGYFNLDRAALDEDGWFHTGDVSTLDADGYMKITDRSKDVIKSGGEWISSIDLENTAVGHADVAEAAVVGVRHPKWDERPIMLIVAKPGRTVTEADIRDYLSDKIASWWRPDRIYFVDEIPHTATGKILKTALRDEYADVLMTAGG